MLALSIVTLEIMKINRIIMINHILLTSSLLFIVLSSFGQNYEKVLREQQNLKEQIVKQEKDSISITESLIAVKTASERLKADIEALRKEQEMSERGMSEEVIAEKEKTVGDLRKEQEKLSETLEALKSEQQAKTKQIADLKKHTSDLNVYKGDIAKLDYEKCKAMLTMPYSQLDVETLQGMMASADQFKMMTGFEDYKQRLAFTIKNKSLYDLGRSLLTKKYNYDTVNGIAWKVRNLRTQKANAAKKMFALSDEQKDDLFDLDRRTSRYTDGIIELQKIVMNINKDRDVKRIRSEKDKTSDVASACKEAMKKYLVPSETNKLQYVIDYYFSMIPYLGDLFAKYKHELSENPLVETEIEKEILNYVTK